MGKTYARLWEGFLAEVSALERRPEGWLVVVPMLEPLFFLNIDFGYELLLLFSIFCYIN
jgi:hypothetical protein